jgi:hypothetical protein
MLEALKDHLLRKPSLYLDEMVIFLWDEFETMITTISIRRALASISWSKKVIRKIARERNADIRDHYSHIISPFKSWQLMFVDESGCDTRVGFGRHRMVPKRCKPQAGHQSLQESTASTSCQHMPKMVSYEYESLKTPPMVQYSKTILSSFSSAASHLPGRDQSL